MTDSRTATDGEIASQEATEGLLWGGGVEVVLEGPQRGQAQPAEPPPTGGPTENAASGSDSYVHEERSRLPTDFH